MVGQVQEKEREGLLLPLLQQHCEETMKDVLVRLWKDEDGQDLVEYGLLLVLIALISISFVRGIGVTLSAIFSNANTAMANPGAS